MSKYYNHTYKLGTGILSTLAAIISWDMNHSFWWALWHGLCSAFYLIYYYFKYAS